jgi:hypothetical protein
VLDDDALPRRSGQVVWTMPTSVGAPSDLGVNALERSLGERPAASTVMRFYDAYLYNSCPIARATATGDRRMALRISGLGPARTRVGGSCATTE